MNHETKGKYPINRPCSACSAGDYKMEYHDHEAPFREGYGPVPSGTQDEREREIRSKVEWTEEIKCSEVAWLLSLLDAERKRVQELQKELGKPEYYWRRRYKEIACVDIFQKQRVQELQEHEDAEAAFMAKRGVLYNCTFIDGWTKVLDERDELKQRVQELEGALRKMLPDCYFSPDENGNRICNYCMERGKHEPNCMVGEAESLLSKEKK